MKRYFLFILTILISTHSYSQEFKNRMVLGNHHAANQIKEALADKKIKPYYDSTEKTSNIDTKEKAIKFAEAITFRIYGKDQILKERPYECYLINGYWYVSGTLPDNYVGGTFEIIFSKKDSKIIRITHYK